MSRYEWSVAGIRLGWRDLVVPVLPACAQLASGPGGGSGMLVAVSTGLAGGALVLRRVAPVLALAGTLTAVLLCAGAGAVGAPVAVLIALHALAVNRTAGFALAGSAMATLVAAGTAAVLGEPRPMPAAVEVSAYRIAAMLMTAGATITMLRLDAGVELSGPGPADPGVRRRLRAMADATGGTLSATADGAVRVWLPGVFPSRSG